MPPGVLSFYTPNTTFESSCFPTASSTEMSSYSVPKKLYPGPGIQLVGYMLTIYVFLFGTVLSEVDPYSQMYTIHFHLISQTELCICPTNLGLLPSACPPQMCKPETWDLFLPSHLSSNPSLNQSPHPISYLLNTSPILASLESPPSVLNCCSRLG